jgi:hypothetical protein
MSGYRVGATRSAVQAAMHVPCVALQAAAAAARAVATRN